MSALNPVWTGASYAPHQEAGINWMLKQEIEGYAVPENTEVIVRGGILGDEMGLGKTFQSLGLIVNGSHAMKTLIVSPLAVKKQWEDAAKRCNVNLFTPTPHGGKWLCQVDAGLGRPIVHVAHYDKIANKPMLCEGQQYDRVILDEAQTIRNAGTKKALSVLEIPAKYKWALTATPIVNGMDDVVTYLKFIGFNKIIGSSGKWRPNYELWIRNCYLARTIDCCEAPAGLTMPPEPIIEDRHLDFTSEDEAKVYAGIYDNIESQWRKAQALQGGSYMLAMFSILLRLRQISVNPQIYIKARQKEAFGWSGPEFAQVSRKFDEISHLLRESHEAGQSNRWIIFCQFHEEMEMLADFLKAFPFIGSVLQYHGGMSMKERDAAIKASHLPSTDAKQDVFLIQLQAGGTGLNLQHYDRIIFVSPWWTSALLDQARGRAVRIGQKNVVKVYWLKLKTESTFNIDSFIMEKAEKKRDLGETFLGWSVNTDAEITTP
jgi:SNF2 family DNA or RNA helicase